MFPHVASFATFLSSVNELSQIISNEFYEDDNENDNCHPGGNANANAKLKPKIYFEIICVNLLTNKKTLALAFHPDGKANANAKANAY